MSDSFSASSCKICFDNYDGNAKKPELMVPCGHTFCKECLWKLLTPECPTCKMAYQTTVTVWDLIPSAAAAAAAVSSAADETAGESGTGIQGELANFKTLLEHVEELNRTESELNATQISDAEAMINAKAEEVINRVIDEQNNLLHRVIVYKSVLGKRTARNNMMESFARKQFELICLQANYNSQQLTDSGNASDRGLVRELKQEMIQLKSLKDNIELFIKSYEPIFCDQSSSGNLIGQILLPDENGDLVKSSQAKAPQDQSTVQTQAVNQRSNLNPEAAPFDANHVQQHQHQQPIGIPQPFQLIQPALQPMPQVITTPNGMQLHHPHPAAVFHVPEGQLGPVFPFMQQLDSSVYVYSSFPPVYPGPCFPPNQFN